jgi:NAD(P)-dependent dehydrogenase (short-subunit alcohol dehydrogenase family)
LNLTNIAFLFANTKLSYLPNFASSKLTNNQMSKIALVTGGSRGLGKDEAIQLAQKGFDVIITYQSNKAEADKVVDEIRTLGKKSVAMSLDISSTKGFDVFVSHLKEVLASVFEASHIDALINNAGTGFYAPYTQTSEDDFDAMMNIHLKSPYFLTQKLLPLINDGGVVLNTSSGLARFAYAGSSAYGSMKAALDMLTRYQALEFGQRKIRVNSIAPGAIATDFGGGRVRDNKDLSDLLSSRTALGRVGLADDIGSVAAFLCSDESKWINGQRIEVAGGIHL